MGLLGRVDSGLLVIVYMWLPHLILASQWVALGSSVTLCFRRQAACLTQRLRFARNGLDNNAGV